jgi:hypothetical protein
MQKVTEAFLESYGCTSYWRDAVNEYGIGDALYERTVVLPVPSVLGPEGGTQASEASLGDGEDAGQPDFTGDEAFTDWVSDAVNAGLLGPLGAEDIPVFFLPQSAQIDSSDCQTEGGYHWSLPVSGKTLVYAVIDLCPISDELSNVDLMNRTYAASHELIEAATDPLGGVANAWRALGPGVIAPSVLLPQVDTAAGADELVDYCNSSSNSPLDYPFTVAVPYSNRRARAGLDPCSTATPLDALAVLSTTAGVQPAPVDLSSGSTHATVDVFAADPSATYRLIVYASLSTMPAGYNPSLLGPSPFLQVHDGDSIALTLQLPSPPVRVEISNALDPRNLVSSVLCVAPDDAETSSPDIQCESTRDPIVGLPPFLNVDAGAPDVVTGDGPGSEGPDADASEEASSGGDASTADSD